jgi:hypothetical protein
MCLGLGRDRSCLSKALIVGSYIFVYLSFTTLLHANATTIEGYHKHVSRCVSPNRPWPDGCRPYLKRRTSSGLAQNPRRDGGREVGELIN